MKKFATLISPLFLAGLYFIGPASAGDDSLFYLESPADPAAIITADIAVWDRFWIGGKEVAIVSASADQESSLATITAEYGEIGPIPPGQGLFIVTAPRGIDLAFISAHSAVLLHGEHVALIKTDQTSAGALAAGGMEIAAVLPPPGAAPSARPMERASMVNLAWDSKIQEIIDQVNQSDVNDALGNLSGENSVTVGGSPYTIQTRNSYQTTPITNATQYCYEYFQNLGLSASYHDYTSGGNNWRNVVGEQAGFSDPDSIYIICAHLDDMPSGSVAPGADDNASGSVSVLLAAEILSGYGFDYTLRYVLFTGEEQGLLGSYYYVQDLVAAGDNILGALNFDMIAYDGDADGRMEVHCGTIAASETIGDLLIDTINEYGLSLTAEKFTNGSVGASDHARFWNAGYPAILGIEDTWYGATSDFNPYYHTTSDTRANCDLSYTTDYVKAAVGTTARLGGVMATTPTPTITATPTITPTPTQTPVGGYISFQPSWSEPAEGWRKADDSPFGTYGTNYGWR